MRALSDHRLRPRAGRVLLMGMLTLAGAAAGARAQEDPPPLPAAEPSPEPWRPARLSMKESEDLRNLFTMLRHKKVEVRRETEDAIVAMGPNVLPKLIDALRRRDAATTERVWSALDRLLDPAMLPWLETFAHHRTALVRRFVYYAHAREAGAASRESLLPGLEDRDDEVRYWAAIGLARQGAREGVAPLHAAYQTAQAAQDGARIEQILEALRAVPPKDLLALLKPLLHTGDVPPRLAAYEIVTRLEIRPAVREFLRGMDDEDRLVKEAAVNGLRRLVEHKDPLEVRSVFDLIEEVERWRAWARKPHIGFD